MPNQRTPNLATSSTRWKASCVVSSLGALAPVASTLQYLHRALHAPVERHEVISNGPLCSSVFVTRNTSCKFYVLTFLKFTNTLQPKKDFAMLLFGAVLVWFAVFVLFFLFVATLLGCFFGLCGCGFFVLVNRLRLKNQGRLKWLISVNSWCAQVLMSLLVISALLDSWFIVKVLGLACSCSGG